jgi:hypothetical protein
MPGALARLKASVPSEDRPVSLVADFYELLGDLGVADWDADNLMTSSRLGTLGRCSSILADYEAVRRRSRPHPDEAGAQTAANWYYMNLAIYIANYAKGAYEDYDGEPALQGPYLHASEKGSRHSSNSTIRSRQWLGPSTKLLEQSPLLTCAQLEERLIRLLGW